MPNVEPVQRRRSPGRRVLLLIGIWSIPALATAISAIAQFQELEDPPPLGMLILRSSFFWYIYAALTPFVHAMHRRRPLDGSPRSARITFHLGASLVFAVMAGALSVTVSLFIDADEISLEIALNRLLQSWGFLIWGAILYWIILAVSVSIENARAARIQLARAATLERQLTEARLNALRAQLQPHFLFNTLNGIASLVRQARTEQALDMINRLSGLLRASLRRDDEPLISLVDEIELLEQYLAIEQARFGDRLSIDIDIESETAEFQIPPLLLQPLVENAVRHGIAPQPEGGAISIRAELKQDRLEITIVNDGAPWRPEEQDGGEGVGLPNTRERLRVAYGDEARLELVPREEGGTQVTMRLPLIRADEGAGR